MDILHVASAGTQGTNDILVQVSPAKESGIKIELESDMMNLYGKAIEKKIMETVKQLDVSDVEIKAFDKGALDYTISARVETALKRASK